MIHVNWPVARIVIRKAFLNFNDFICAVKFQYDKNLTFARDDIKIMSGITKFVILYVP